MKYVLLHGSGGGPDMWLPWLEKELKSQGHEVWMPTIPNSDPPDTEKQLKYVQESGEITPGCIMVAHSSGCRLVLRILEESNTHINQAILVAGSYRQMEFNYEKIKQNCDNFVLFASDDDPWGCDDRVTRPYFEQLGGTMVVVKGGGHFGSNTYQKPLYEFPLLLKFLG